MAKQKVIDARERELRSRKRAAKRRARLERAQTETASAGLRRIYRLPEVCAVTSKSRTSIMEDVALGRFPKPIKIGQRSVGWLIEDVEGWIKARANERIDDPNIIAAE